MAEFNADLKAIAEKLVAHCMAGTEEEGLKELYAADAVSVEALPMGDMGAEAAGLEAIKGKHDWWNNTMEVHSADVKGPYLHGDDQFAVWFQIDATDKTTGERSEMSEVGVYTVKGGKIVREAFFYALS
ncbi:MAG: nuclear transport factor 2 family protein [Pseudomonadota bacterium]